MKVIRMLKPFIVLILVFVLFFHKLFIKDDTVKFIIVGLVVGYLVVDVFSLLFMREQK